MSTSLRDSYGSFYKTKKSEDIEQKIAKELQRMKIENESKQRLKDKICAESEEIRELKEKINAAYVNKARAAQVSEAQIRKMNEIKREAEVDNLVLTANQEHAEKIKQQELDRRLRQTMGKDVLKQQIEERKHKSAEAYEQYLKERNHVDQIVQNIIEEDIKANEIDKQRKAQAFRDMQETLELRKHQREKEQEREKIENQKYKQFMEMVDKREESHKAQRAEIEAAKEKIYQKLKEDQEKKKKEQELLEDLRFELQQEEYDAMERKKEQLEVEKKRIQRDLMIQWEKEDIAYKQARKEEEMRMEQEFKKKMMEKFAEDEKLEQLSQQKRRMKELEVKREVEKLWQEKLQLYRIEREREILEARKAKEEEEYKKLIIEREKERILQEHLPKINGFLPKSLATVSEFSKYN